MALYDWNKDGKKDLTDDFIEYQIYKRSTSNKDYTPRTSGGISTFGAIVASVGGLFLACGIQALLGMTELPVIITVILWIICSAVLAVWFDNNNF
ncbi:MAG: hypothetical protein IKL73_05590 [Lachnospiraceae bacterium]|nr:hypothetical protein [Lachnospiraceae bacterium]